MILSMLESAKSELISIITPSYNSAGYISDTIRSIQWQSYQNWELIIVDDASKDNSVDVINQFVNCDARIKLHVFAENKGAAEARNFAISTAKGDFIAFLDSDDIWYEQKLEQQLDFMQRNNYPFTFTSYAFMDEAGNSLGDICHAKEKVNYSDYLKDSSIGCLTVMVNKAIIGEFRMPLLRSGQDMALWLLIMKRGFTAYGIDECLACYRIGKNSLSSNKLMTIVKVWRIYRHIEKLSFLYSIYLIVCFTFNAFRKKISLNLFSFFLDRRRCPCNKKM